MRPRTPLAVVALAAGLACGKDTPAAPAVKEAPAARALEVATLPADTRVIIGARVPRVLESPVLRRLVDQALARDPDARARMESLLGRCKIDLARDVEGVTIAMGEPTDVALLVSGKIDPAALLGCVRAEAGELDESRRGGRTVYATRDGNGQKVWLAFEGATVVAATSERWMDAVLDPARPTIATRADTQALLARVDRDAAVWGVGYLPPVAETRMGELTGGAVKAPPRAVSFAVALGKDPPISAALRLEMASASDAAALASVASRQRDLLAIAAQRHGLGRMVSKTHIDADGAGLRLALRLDEPDVRLLEEAMSPKVETKEQGR
jgi:hypothetical protein